MKKSYQPKIKLKVQNLGHNWKEIEGPFREHENNLYTNLSSGHMYIHMSKAIEIYI